MSGTATAGDAAMQRQLSADAAVFVPQEQTLPKYMYSCYPFVVDAQHKGNATFGHNNADGKAASLDGPHCQLQLSSGGGGSVHPGDIHGRNHYYFNNGANCPPAPHCNGTMRHYVGAGYPPPARFGSGYYTTPSPLLQSPAGPSHCLNSGSILSHFPPPHPHLSHTGRYNASPVFIPSPGTTSPASSLCNGSNGSHLSPVDPNTSSYNPHSTYTARALGYTGSGHKTIAPASYRKQQYHKSPSQSTGVSSRSKVSVGTQNEAKKSMKTSSSQACSKTLVTVAAQTDFSSEIANQTLEQTPNALYQGSKRKLRRKTTTSRGHVTNTVADTTTDSEELDHSDSGYSSPLHRRNQVSNGTDTATNVTSTAASERSSTTAIPSPAVTACTKPPTYTCAQISTGSSSSLFHAASSLTSNPGQLGVVPQLIPLSYASALSSTHQKSSSIHPDSSQRHLSDAARPSHGSAGQNAQVINGAPTTVYTDGMTACDNGNEAGAEGTGKRKRKRGRRRRKKGDQVGVEESAPSTAKQSLSAKLHSSQPTTDDVHVDQSPILSQEDPVALLAPENLAENFPSFSELYDDMAEFRLSGKRKKRRELANKAALEEQLEIDLEQQALKVVNHGIPKSYSHTVQQATSSAANDTTAFSAIPSEAMPKSSGDASGGKRSQQMVSVNLLDLVKASRQNTNVNRQSSDQNARTVVVGKKATLTPKSVLNPLDSTAPSVKRGKERDAPKAKKPSALKKVILKEREERKRLRYIGEGPVEIIDTPDSSVHFTSEPENEDDDDDDNDDGDAADDDDGDSVDMVVDTDPAVEYDDTGSAADVDACTPRTQDMSPLSQNSPISGILSPATTLSNPSVAGTASPSVIHDVMQKIHSRRFREYCNQVLDKDIDEECTRLLQSLVKFQDRLYHKDPIKAKSKRRLVLGLREVTKHLKLHKIKLVIISPNLEKIQSKGGLDDALNLITALCREQDVPFVFALGRRSLGRACAKLVPVSVVGVFNYQGAEVMFKKLMDLTSQARAQYMEMIDTLAKEKAEYGEMLKGSSGLYFSHLGHSRTPSGCSVISFSSSIQSEPQTDLNCDTCDSGRATNSDDLATSSLESSSTKESHVPLQDDIYDIDEGNEADTEDNDSLHTAITAPGGSVTPSCSEESKVIYNNNNNNSGNIQEKCVTVESLSQSLSSMSLKRKSRTLECDKRSSTSSGHLDIVSHASSRTVDVQSNHSSLTIEEDVDAPVDTLTSSSASSSKFDRVHSWVRDINSPQAQQQSQAGSSVTLDSMDDVEFDATLTACEANTEVLMSRGHSRSGSLSSQPQAS